MRIALAQINPTVGDIAGNTRKIIEGVRRAEAEAIEVVVFPELAVLGYPPKDLVLRREIIEHNMEAVRRIASECKRTTAIIGYAHPDSARTGQGVFNAAGICRGGKLESSYAKMLLPQYDVFDEARYFSTGDKPHIVNMRPGAESLAGITICEDIWNNEQFEGRQVYGLDPVDMAARAGARLLINLSASPYRAGVEPQRERLFASQLREHGIPLIYVNQFGGNDDLVFDGASMAMDATGRVIARARCFEEDFLIVDLSNPAGNRVEAQPDFLEGMHKAIVLGLRDYVLKCGFRDVVLGLSGGIDSALTAVVAVEALGADHIHGVALPSRFSSPHSLEDAKLLAANLSVDFRTIPIEEAHLAMEKALRGPFSGMRPDVTEENVQSRIRANILMALSNKFGWLLLTTGNKSELAVGYCTLYGDMAGGFAPLIDVSKTKVYELARRINEKARRPLIPLRTLDRPPTAELRPAQTDQDVLPPYDVLDPILEQYIEQGRHAEQIIESGFDRKIVEWVVRMVRMTEHKRKQAAPGPKVTSRAFGTGRRYPIAAKYDSHA